MRLVHAADLHVDSPLVGLERHEGAPVEAVRGATRRALENLVALCIERQADLLVIAGDLFDGRWRDFSTGLFFVKQMARLRDAGVRVVVARGNHDAESILPRSLRLPENVRELSATRPESLLFEDLGVAVHGQSYETRAVTRDLALGYPSAVPGALNVGVLHTALDGRPGHEAYAPTTERRLIDRGYDYWALGHVHTREVVREADPVIVFPGNLQGRHARERGAKGATVVEATGRRITSVEHAPLDVVRWDDVEVHLDEGDGLDEALDRARAGLVAARDRAGGRLVCARVRLVGRSGSHATLAASPRTTEELRAVALDVGADLVWLAAVASEVRAPLDPEALASRADAVGRLAAAARTCGADAAAAQEVLGALAGLTGNLPPSVLEGALPDPADSAARATFFAEVEELLWARLGDHEGGIGGEGD